MTISQLFQNIEQRITKRKDEIYDVCNAYGEKMQLLYNAYQAGHQEQAIKFAAYWMPWMLNKGVVSLEELIQLSDAERLKMGIYMAERNLMLNDGRSVLINCDATVTSSARAFTFGKCNIKQYDESTVHAYNRTFIEHHSGWTFAYGKSIVECLGMGIIEAYDDAVIMADKGKYIVTLNDDAVAKKISSGVQVYDKTKST